ncbi:hypothetical protein [Dehalogenimonas alkenigignens]|uniref:hypothetical protein n=1 Tax=Dehalogenimonas alkenigignens TaxID=1217799 RepID=UPI001057A4DB|nr:hypothetical protein [Dehalogenimonas alkenigignens]
MDYKDSFPMGVITNNDPPPATITDAAAPVPEGTKLSNEGEPAPESPRSEPVSEAIRPKAVPDAPKAADSRPEARLPEVGSEFNGMTVVGIDKDTGRVELKPLGSTSNSSGGSTFYTLVDGELKQTGPTGILIDVLYDRNDDRAEAAKESLKEFIKDGQIDVTAALEAGVSTSKLADLGYSATEINAYKKAVKDEAEFKESHQQLEDGTWVNKAEYAKWQEEAKNAEGQAAADAIRDRAIGLAGIIGLKPFDILNPDGTINSARLADKLGGKPSDYKTIEDVMQRSTEIDSGRFKDSVKELLTFGQATTKTFNQDDLALEYDKAAWEASKNGLALQESKQEYVTRVLNSQGSTGQVVGDFSLGMVPFAGTVAFWDKMDGKGRVLSAGLDVLTFVPLVGIASAGVRAGQGAAKSFVKAVIAEAKSPFTALTRPVDTVKSALYPLETLVRPNKIPLSALEVQFSTVRYDVVKELGVDPKTAMLLRDEATMAQIKGAKPIASTPGGPEIQLTNKALNTTIAPVAVHATPDVRPFLNGIEIVPGVEGKGLFVAPSLHSRFSQLSAFGLATADKPIKGALLIRDPEVLAQLKPSNKLYKGTVEIEATLPPGTKLGKPTQIAVTRDAAGDLMVLPVFGPKLTAKELAQMKIVGSVDTVRDIFRPAKSLKNRAYDDLLQHEALIRQNKQELKALKKQGRFTEAKGLSKKIEDLEIRRIELERRAAGASAGSLSTAALRFKRSTIQEEVRNAVRAQRTKPGERLARVDGVRRGRAGGRSQIAIGALAIGRRGRAQEDRARATLSRRILSPEDRRPPPPAGRRIAPPGDRVPVPDRDNPPPPDPPPPPFEGKGISVNSGGKHESGRPKMMDGDVAWKQGMWWIIKRKNGNRIYSHQAPEGAKRLDGTPAETFFTRGLNPQHKAVQEMGITKARIDLSNNPRINFVQNRPPKPIRQSIPRNVRRQIGMR